MQYFMIFCVLLVIGGFIALLLGKSAKMSIGMPPPTETAGGRPLAPGSVTGETLAAVRFDRAFRGYRMDQVDALLDRLREDYAARSGDAAASTAALPGADVLAVDLGDAVRSLPPRTSDGPDETARVAPPLDDPAAGASPPLSDR